MIHNHKDANYSIALHLFGHDLINTLSINKEMYKLSQDKIFWINKINHDFPFLTYDLTLKYSQNYKSWSQYYLDLYHFKNKFENYQLISVNAPDDVLENIRYEIRCNRIDLIKIYFYYCPDYNLKDYEKLKDHAEGYYTTSLYPGCCSNNRLKSNNLLNHFNNICYYGHLNLLKYFISLGYDDHNNSRHVDAGIMSNNIDLVKYLIDIGYRKWENSYLTLGYANLEMLKYIISITDNFIEDHLQNTLDSIIDHHPENVDIIEYLTSLN